MNKTMVVAKWEYLEKVKSKAFLMSLIITPAITVAMSLLPSFFAAREDKDTKVIGVIDQSGQLVDSIAQRMEAKYKFATGAPRYLVQVLGSGRGVALDEVQTAADGKVSREEIEGYFIIRANPGIDSVVEYRSRSVGDFRLTNRFEETLRDVLQERKVASLGLEASVLRQLKVNVDVKPVKLSKGGEAEEASFLKTFMMSYISMMVLFFLIFTSGQLLVRSMMEEKSNRIVEILVSSCSPTELMAGKVLGLSMLGFTQLAFWGLVGFAVTAKFSLAMIPPGQAALLVLYFVLGYLFYASIFVALGSPVTTEQEAQQINGYLVIFLILPIAMSVPAMQNPNASWLKVISFIPFFTPTTMALRIPIQMPATWELIVTTLLMVVCIVIGMWVAGRIFRIAILATGKRPSVKEMMQWIMAG